MASVAKDIADRDRRILDLIRDNKSYAEIGLTVGISRERVRQIADRNKCKGWRAADASSARVREKDARRAQTQAERRTREDEKRASFLGHLAAGLPITQAVYRAEIRWARARAIMAEEGITGETQKEVVARIRPEGQPRTVYDWPAIERMRNETPPRLWKAIAAIVKAPSDMHVRVRYGQYLKRKALVEKTKQ